MGFKYFEVSNNAAGNASVPLATLCCDVIEVRECSSANIVVQTKRDKCVVM